MSPGAASDSSSTTYNLYGNNFRRTSAPTEMLRLERCCLNFLLEIIVNEYFKTFFKDIFCLLRSLGWSGLVSHSMRFFSRKMVKFCLSGGFLLAMMFALPMLGKKGPCGHPWSPDPASHQAHSRLLQAQPQPKCSEPSQNS